MDINDLLGGGGAGGFDLNALMQKAQQMQSDVVEAQERALAREVVGEAGGGMVKVTANGKMEILKVAMDPAVVDPEDREMLEDLVTAACNDAIRKARAVMEEELGDMAGMLQAGGLKL